MVSIAMIFPGQGSQKIGALSQLSKQNIIIKDTFEEASEYLKYNLWKLINYGPFKKINQSKYAQPLILVSSIAIYRLWKKMGGCNPHISAGHSLGEYSALVCGNSINFEDAVKFIQQRGKIMENCVQNQEVCMKVISGLREKTILNLCKKYSNYNIVNIASINAKTQIVISGHKIAVEKTAQECKKIGAKLIVNIPINISSHCEIMKKISIKISQKLRKISFQTPLYTILNSIFIKKYQTKKDICDNLTKQLYHPVQWEKTVKVLQKNTDITLEVGPREILTNLYKKYYFSKCISINNPQNFFLALELSQNKTNKKNNSIN
ncbi:ACP S-malonyltransferase [Buchnera aphidicola]|uniref:ACP S-malonyltransferase n=1 Tax=Buchnera aphidicola TaxID=9 RepID=UPI00346447FE